MAARRGGTSTAKRKPSARAAAEEVSPTLTTRLIWLGLAAVWLFLAASLVSFNGADAPTHAVWPVNDPTQNWMGPIGAHAAWALVFLLGWGVAPLLVGGAVALVLSATGRWPQYPMVRSVGTLVIAASVATLAHVLAPNASLPMPRGAGGIIGVVSGHELVSRFHTAGAMLWALLALAIGLVLAFDRLAFVAAEWSVRRVVELARRTGVGIGSAASKAKARQRVRQTDLDDAEAELAKPRRKRKKPEPVIDEQAGGLGGVEDFDPDEELVDEEDDADEDAEWEEDEEWDEEDEYEEDDEYEDEEEDDDAHAPAAGLDDDEEDDEELAGAPQVFDRDKLKEKIAALPVRFAGANRQSATDEDLETYQNAATLEGYKFPGLDILEEPDVGFGEILEEHVREQAESLEAALREYKLKGEVVGIESGPVITLYHVKLAPGTKVSQLNAVSSDLARSLKAINIRIVSNMVGRDTVGIEVPNAKKEKVRLKELMSNRALFEKMNLPMFLGKDAAGDPLIADLTKMPHVLIAGTTGSGKSVCMNTIVMSFLYTKKPNELKLVLVDPKMVEMSQFKDIPHLMCPVVTEMSKAAAILEWAVGKMDERYELLAEAGCRDITGYNELDEEELFDRFAPYDADGQKVELSEEEKAKIPRKLPYMVFIIDELADLMMTNKEVEGSIVRIAQKARAVGIHLILATQRPQANVVTGLIKGNMPCRITFKVASGLDSRIVLDQKGGELLLGQGDMLFLSPSSHKLVRSQGTLVDDKEIRRVVKFLRDVAAPSFERSLVQLRGPGGSDEQRLVASENNSSASLAAAQEDPMFDRAVEIVLETRRGSVSLLQRRLAIGYTRASRLIDLMGIAGLIGEHKGSVAREVLVTPEEWAAIKEMADEMAAQQGVAGITARSAAATSGDDPDQTSLFPEDEADDDAVASVVEPKPAEDDAEEEAAEEDETEDETEDEADPEAEAEADDEELGEDEEWEWVEVEDDAEEDESDDEGEEDADEDEEEWDEEDEAWEDEEGDEAEAEPPFKPTRKV